MHGQGVDGEEGPNPNLNPKLVELAQRGIALSKIYLILLLLLLRQVLEPNCDVCSIMCSGH